MDYYHVMFTKPTPEFLLHYIYTVHAKPDDPYVKVFVEQSNAKYPSEDGTGWIKQHSNLIEKIIASPSSLEIFMVMFRLRKINPDDFPILKVLTDQLKAYGWGDIRSWLVANLVHAPTSPNTDKMVDELILTDNSPLTIPPYYFELLRGFKLSPKSSRKHKPKKSALFDGDDDLFGDF